MQRLKVLLFLQQRLITVLNYCLWFLIPELRNCSLLSLAKLVKNNNKESLCDEVGVNRDYPSYERTPLSLTIGGVICYVDPKVVVINKD